MKMPVRDGVVVSRQVILSLFFCLFGEGQTTGLGMGRRLLD